MVRTGLASAAYAKVGGTPRYALHLYRTRNRPGYRSGALMPQSGSLRPVWARAIRTGCTRIGCAGRLPVRLGCSGPSALPVSPAGVKYRRGAGDVPAAGGRAARAGGGTVFRERREERRAERGADHYRMRQELVSIGDDYWIENDRGQRVYKVDGKALRLRKTLIFEDARGAELVKIQERMLHVRDTMEIEDRDGNRVATVKKALIMPLRERWTVTVADGPDLDVKGNIV